MKKAKPAPNRIVNASPPEGGSGSVKPQSGYALCGVLLRHIFAVAGTLRVPLSQSQKRRLQPNVMRNSRLRFWKK
jgi:hypothetical protein